MIIFINELYLINFVKIIELNRSSWFFLDNFYKYLAKTTSIDKMYFELIFSTILIIVLFMLIIVKELGKMTS